MVAVLSQQAPPTSSAAGFDAAPLSSSDRDWIARLRAANEKMQSELRRRIVGQEDTLEQLLIAFFAGGHALLVGVPGLAKTMMVRSLAETLSLTFARIQFTPDLMPSDITGTDIIADNEGDRGFRFLGGPIFHQMILADEINRTPPKTLASLLEAMEEYTVHVGGQRYEVPRPFFVMATQNPIEQEGTYTLPAAALDRFMFNIDVDYPDEDTELRIVEQTTTRLEQPLFTVMSAEEVHKGLEIVRRLQVDDEIVDYATALVRQTRPESTSLAEVREYVAHGASPRAAQALLVAGKARAILNGRDRVLGSDLRAIAAPIMRHRVQCNFHAASEGIHPDEIVRRILRDCPRPRGDLTTEQEARKRHAGAARSMTTIVWGPETRRTLEARQRAKAELDPSRLDQLTRQSRKQQRNDPWNWLVAGLCAALGLTYLISALMLAFEQVPAGITAAAVPLWIAGIAGLFFLRASHVFAVGPARFELAAQRRRFVLPPYGRGAFVLGFSGIFLMQLLALGFVGAQVHGTVSSFHVAWLTLLSIPVTGTATVIDWPGIALAAATLTCVVILFARDDEPAAAS